MFWRTKIVTQSRLYDEKTFYQRFANDLSKAKRRVIIESPFITTKRFNFIYPSLSKVAKRKVKIIINTRDPIEHSQLMRIQAFECVEILQNIGITVLYTSRLHRKVAIIDDATWEGSLNILSQANSCEIMRRTKSSEYASNLIKFIKMSKWYN